MNKKIALAIDNTQYSNLSKEKSSSFINVSDLDIWKQFKSGNESAFIYIYKTHFQNLYNYGLQFSRDASLVEDCIQDLFIDIRRTRKRLSDTTSIKLYLYKAIRRKVLQYLKSSKSKLRIGLLQDGHNFHFTFSHEHYLIAQQLTDEKIKRLNRALSKLPQRQREVIYYFFYEQLSYEEIKEVMNFSNVKSVRNKAYIALKALRKSCE